MTSWDELASQERNTEWALTVMASGAVAVAGGDSESLTCTVKFEVPGVVGVPEISPLLAFRVKPFGKLPWVMLQV